MARVIKRNKALSVSPLKASQTVGAALALLGFSRAIPMLHGSQGCTAFAKVFFVRHFREPIPLQTTAMDQVSTVMGADENVVEGLRTLCEKHRPALVGIPTTALAETQGADLALALHAFRDRHPGYADVRIVPVPAPDFTGSMECGFAAAARAVIEHLVPPAAEAGTVPGRRPRQVNVLAGAFLTPGDLEEIKSLCALFGLRPVVVPDVGDALDGHLAEEDFSPLTTGGTPVAELAHLGDARATIVIGASMAPAADALRERTGVPDFRLDHVLGLEAVDALVMLLHALSGEPVPDPLERQRAQLQDAMLDAHFMLGGSRFAIGAEADLVHAFVDLLASMGAGVPAAVVPAGAAVLERVACTAVRIGDLEDLEAQGREAGVDAVIRSSHALGAAQRLGVPLVRVGFPQYDRLGGYQRTWMGYRGTRQAVFDLANVMLERERGPVAPYHSIYAQKSRDRREEDRHGAAATPAGA